jgi:predicted outer membrane protein
MHRIVSRWFCVALLPVATLVACSSEDVSNVDSGPDGAVVGACGDAAVDQGSMLPDTSGGGVDAGAEASDAADAADVATMVLTDLQIVTVLHTGNLNEIDEAQLALSRAITSQARAFANTMVTDHTAADALLTTLFAPADAGADAADGSALDASLTADGGIPLSDSTTANDLKKQSALEQQAIKFKTATAFDVAYMSEQVSTHFEMLQLIDGVLTPEAQSPALKSVLAQYHTMYAAHLAKALQDLNAIVTGAGGTD